MPRDAAPTSSRRPPRSGALRRAPRIERARDFVDAVRLDQIADLHVVEVLDADAALEALAYLAHVVLEALERRERAVVYLDAAADQPHARRPRNHAGAHEAAGDGADFGDLEDLPHFGLAQHHFLVLGGELALHRGFHFFHRLIDDAVGADLHPLALRRGARVRVGPQVEADDDGARRLGQQDIGVGDRADAAMHDLHFHFAGGELRQRVGQRFGRAALVGLDDQPQRRRATFGALRHEAFERFDPPAAAVSGPALWPS